MKTCPRSWRLLLAFLAGALATVDAAADAQSAAAAYFAHLGHPEGASEASTFVDDHTLVAGVYRLEEKATGRFIAMITESGDIQGDSNGWRWVEDGGLRPLATDEASRLAREVMQAIRWDDLVKVQYGAGGGRRIVLFSAVDCPYCARMEQALAQHAGSLDTTFYVVPMALAPDLARADGRPSWSTATRIWCAADRAGAWRRFWSNREEPGPATCALDAAAAYRIARNFSTVMSSIGARVRGTPAMVREDGAVASFPADPDEHYFSEVLGRPGLPALARPGSDAAARRWLAGAQ